MSIQELRSLQVGAQIHVYWRASDSIVTGVYRGIHCGECIVIVDGWQCCVSIEDVRGIA